MDDFDCPPAMDRDWIETTPGTRWTLQVPIDAVRWCGINALCFGKGGLAQCFHPTADACRVAVDTPEGMVIDSPQGLVCGPIKAEWVVGRESVEAELGYMITDKAETWEARCEAQEAATH
ncbi:MAG: hypothetical protein K9K65_08885 [Desulfarculaceae bacterium]|nr:hypothetical protein [Desulfarculaceae bacterium]MCF8045902.1 hypothetical protein [Desulfarculaceae bacterium]MCF8097942.1 hypothetical protein [Desulfarculaceae bacterium]MCF8121105.1 hypothetical protein [Desulfarculaceae bacterium]